jgi:hypothetical protein
LFLGQDQFFDSSWLGKNPLSGRKMGEFSKTYSFLHRVQTLATHVSIKRRSRATLKKLRDRSPA